MKKNILLISISVLVAAFPIASQAQLVVSPSTPANMVSRLVGTGVTPANIQINGATSNSYGEFDCTGPCNIGFQGGIILTSGNITNALPPNNSPSASGSNNGGSDPQLASIAIGPILDACVLEFDFWAATDSIRFNYHFASEEYNDYVFNTVNDVFGFFINGPGFPTPTNIAVIPGTGGIPVSINTVNNGQNWNGPGPGPCTNCAYYIDNEVQPNPVTTQYDGITTGLVAAAAICPCETYHMKLAIGDVQDAVFDSGVFLEENSFSSFGQIPIYANGQAQPPNATYYICQGTSTTLSILPNQNCPVNIQWSTGSTSSSITVNQGGTYSAFITSPNNPSCFLATYFIDVVVVNPTASITGNTFICPGGSTTLTANQGQTYLWSNGTTTQSINVTSAGNYTVTVSAGTNCSASASTTVTVGNATASITPSGPTNLCPGGNVTLAANNGSSFLWSNGATTQNITVNQSGTYTVTVSQTGGCSATSTPVNVTVNPAPAPSITGNTSICQGTSTSLNAGAGFSSYQWSPTGSTQSIAVTNSGNYTVTVTDANGCTGSASTVVTVNALPTPAITGSTNICPGTNTTLDAGAGYSSYQWSGGLGSNQTASTGTAGTYTVTVTDANGCTASSSATVAIANPVASITPSGATSFCIGQNVDLTANSGSTYLWSNGATSQTINVTQSGTFTVTVTQGGGCTAVSTPMNVTVNPLPTPAISGNTTICQGVTTILDAGAGFAGYQWSPSGNTQTISAGTAGNYTVTVTDANGCMGSASTVLTVNPLPSPAITGNTAFCQGQSTTLDAGSGYSSYQWSGGGGSSQTATFSAGANYTVTVTDANGCSATASTLVTVNPLPTPAISGNTNICQGTSTILDAGAGYANYQWSGNLNTQTITASNAGNYTVTVTDANGCVGSTSVSVTVNALPTPSITGNTVICQGSTSSLDAGAGYANYQWSPSGNTQTISVGTAGSYTVTVTDANGCIGSASTTLTVNPLPTPAITGNTILCQGQSTTLDAGAGYSSYQWSGGAGTSQTATVSAGASYTVTVTDANGCISSTSVVVIVNPLPTPAISGSTNICQGATTTLDAGAGFANYQWSGGLGTNQTINTGTSGSYTVTVTDANGCVGSASTSVTVNALPTPAITGNNIICQGSATVFDAGAGYANYQWSPSGNTQTISAATAGSYTVTVTDANGCTASANITLTVNTATASISAQGPTTFCQGDNVVLAANSGSTYLWSNGATTQNITVNTSGNFTVSVTAANGCTAVSTPLATTMSVPTATATAQSSTTLCPGGDVTITANTGSSYQWSGGQTTQSILVSQAGNYSVSVTNSDGCVAVSNIVSVTQSQPTASITPLGPTTFCSGQDVTLEANLGLSYLWSTGATTRTILVNTPGAYSVTVTNADNCTAISTPEQITVNTATAAITPQGSTTFCPGSTVVLQANLGQSYLWSDGQTSQNITVGVAGNYTVTVVNLNGCTATSSQVSTNVSIPQATITPSGSTTICPGSTITLTANQGSAYLWSTGETTQSIAAGNAGNYTVVVTNSDGCDTISSPLQVVVDVPIAVATAQGPTNFCIGDNVTLSANAGSAYLWNNGATTQSITATAAGIYSVVVTNATGCTTSSNNINVTTMTAVANITPQGPTVFCPGGQVTLEANSGLSYIWSNGATTQTITVSDGGAYTVNVVNNNGCDATSTPMEVTISPLPQISFTADALGGCDPFTPQFINNTITDQNATYVWLFGDSSTSTSINPSHMYSGVGQYTVTLQVTSGFGCYAEYTYPNMITVSESPVADFIFINENGGGEPLQFNSTIKFIDQSVDASHWIWNFGDGFTSNDQNPIHTYSEAGDFRIKLTVFNQYGCPASKEAQLMVTPFFIPNAFTPDGDGRNDAFFNVNFEMNVADFELAIFDRWGNRIFKTEDPRRPWRGQYNDGTPAAQGVYVYQFRIKDHNDIEHEYRGSVTLVR